MKKVRKVLSSFVFIHGLILLGMFALYGYIATQNAYILLGMALSFAGAMCGSFIRLGDKIDALKAK